MQTIEERTDELQELLKTETNFLDRLKIRHELSSLATIERITEDNSVSASLQAAVAFSLAKTIEEYYEFLLNEG